MRIQLNKEKPKEEQLLEYEKNRAKSQLKYVRSDVIRRHQMHVASYSEYRDSENNEIYIEDSERELLILYSCKNCGAELYGLWKKISKSGSIYLYEKAYDHDFNYNSDKSKIIYNENQETYEKLWQEDADDISRILNMEQCICCGAKLTRDYGYHSIPFVPYQLEKLVKGLEEINRPSKYKFINTKKLFFVSRNSISDISENYKYLNNIRTDVELIESDKKAKNYSKACDLPAFVNVEPAQVADIKNNPDKLKEYILTLLKLEMNIFSLEKRLPQLYYQKYEYDRAANCSIYSPYLEIKQKILKAESDYSKCLRVQKTYQSGQFSLTQPKQPSKPILKTPGLFNKKKIEEENRILEANYQNAIEKYQNLLAEYESEKLRMLNKAESDVKKSKEFLESLKSQEDNYDFSKAENLPAVQFKNTMDKEIENAELLLKNTYQCRNELYSLNVIFDKYRTPISLSTFYEYLMSGRCTSLEGTDGAYNIYEQEIRLDRIIDQMDTVIEKLEDIKRNQYMIYKELTYVNQNLEQLNEIAESIDKSVNNIAETNEMIAYNTAATAYYSKMNAELTNSLGYLIAFK